MGASLLPSPEKDLPMSKLLAALKRTLAVDAHDEPTPHFHQSTTPNYPEVCYDDACRRPQL
jgi:hypothetical protein